MGIIGDVTAETVGTSLIDTTTAEARRIWKEALELLGAAADEVGGDNPKRSLNVALQVRGIAEKLHNHVDYSSGQAKLNLSSAPTPAAPQELPTNEAAPAVQASVNTELSEAEKLGNRLLEIFGNKPVDANNLVQFVGRAVTHDVHFFPFMYQVLNSLTRTTGTDEDYRDKLVETREGFMLQSHRDLRSAKDEADKAQQAFEQLFKDLFGGAVPAGDINGNLRDARDEIKTLKRNVSPDTIFEAIKIASGIERIGSETVSIYLTRVITEYSTTMVKLYDEIKRQSGVESTTGESMANYIGRVRSKLLQDASAAYSKLLNDIGTAINYERGTMNDNEYQAKLLKAMERLQQDSANFYTAHKALEQVAEDNGLTQINGEGTLELAARIINHKRKLGGKLDVSAITRLRLITA
jgi:hypothetical protein